MINLFSPTVSGDSLSAVGEVFLSGWLGEGPVTERFEKEFANYVGAKYAVAVNSATSALHLATIVSDIQEGDEVLTTPMTFISTNHVILYQKATPVFVDVEESTLNLDLTKAEKLITSKTKAIMVIHYGGNPLNMDRLYEFASSYNLAVIEDAAHACGAEYNGRKIGSFGLTCFSFHAVKNLPIGDGGMITLNDEEKYERLRHLRWMGINKSTYDRSGLVYDWEYYVPDIGYKYHMNDISAAIGVSQLPPLEQGNKRRREIANMYRDDIKNCAFLEETPLGLTSQHLFVIKSENRNKLHEHLKCNGIATGVHYKPNTYYPLYKKYDKGKLVISQREYERILSLPMHLKLTDMDIEYIIGKVNDY